MRALLIALLASVMMGTAASAQSTDLKSALQLRPDQMAAYQRFEREAGPQPDVERRRAQEAARLAIATTPERIDWTTRQMEEDLATLRRQGAAVKAFYAQLTPGQRRVFDRQTAPPAR